VTIDAARPVLVLGIGNILWADEGFGVRCVEELHRRWSFPDDVLVMDGGTQGLYLVHYVQAAKRVIVFDAIDYGEEPGTLKLVRGDEVPKFTGAKKMSLHQTGFQDVLSAAELLGGTP
jgi:hydrogenase maturation protease